MLSEKQDFQDVWHDKSLLFPKKIVKHVLSLLVNIETGLQSSGRVFFGRMRPGRLVVIIHEHGLLVEAVKSSIQHVLSNAYNAE
jgi:hypothetical protein